MKHIVIILLFFMSALSDAQDTLPRKQKPEFYHHPGVQAGYANAQANRLELGANYYWSAVVHSRKNKESYHTFGPSASAIVLFPPHKAIAGLHAAVDYHFWWGTGPRINLAYENYFNGDQRIGIDVGVSCIGFFLYGGYYQPVGKLETQGISAWRLGIRFVLNVAAGDAVPVDS